MDVRILFHPVSFALFSAGFCVAFAMSIDDKLFGSTRTNSVILAIVYLFSIALLYDPPMCSGSAMTLCQYVQTVVANIDLKLNPNAEDWAWAFSGILGTTVGLSGTRSKRWLKLAAASYAVFVILFFLSVQPKL